MGRWDKKIAYSPRQITCRGCRGHFTVNFYSNDPDRYCYKCKQKQAAEKREKKQKKEREAKGHGDFE